jgi:hypothetical protein
MKTSNQANENDSGFVDEHDYPDAIANVESNEVAITAIHDVRRIVDSCVLGGFKVAFTEKDGQHTIRLEKAPGRTPVAVKKTELLRIRNYTDGNEIDWYDLAHNGGEDGFEAFLIELAAFIESPLMVLEIESNQDFDEFGATGWLIQPGNKELLSLGVGLDC